MKTSWKDWWASSTIRFNAYMTGLMTTLMPVVLLLDEAKLASLGLSEKAVTVSVLAIAALSGLWNKRLRARTDTPLAGRSSTGGGYDDGGGA